jgi:signal transduction histidine kinase
MGANVSRRRRWADGRGGLTRRAVVASALLLILIGGAFAFLVLAIMGLRQAVDLANHSRHVLATANYLERLVIDLETGQRGFIIAGDARFLQPWTQARAAIPVQSATLERLAAARSAEQGKRARQIERSIEAYMRDYSVPTVEAARRDPASVGTVEVTQEGKRRVDAIRTQFQRFVAYEDQLLALRQGRAAEAVTHATVAAAAGVAGSTLLVLAFDGYVIRSIVRPVRRASIMAGNLAAGDLSVRMLATEPGEIGALEQSFNSMASNLEASRDELRRIAEEQAALRRVATVVARAISPSVVFIAVAAEVGRILEADCTAIMRYEPDGGVTVVGSWSKPSAPQLLMPIGSSAPLQDETASALVLRTGRPARVTNYKRDASGIFAWARERGINSSIGSPIVVEGRLWGVVVAFWAARQPLPEDTEEPMLEFTELVATAIANTESRAELAASRARVVAAADESRRRIERDLHDGAQQRLVSLGLELRMAEAAVPAEQDKLKQQLSRTAEDLADVVEELRELSRGLHPAILSKGGLALALKALARRSAVPVELNVNIGRRLAESIEVAAYFVVSEALTNAAKHAQASAVHVDLNVEDTVLRLSVHDDGIGGADPRQGSGLIGLRDRVEAIGGRIHIESPAGKGTSLLVTIPIDNT